MLNTKQILAASLAILMASASSALAGTKFQGNIVPATTSTSDTLSTKGKLQVKDTGALQASLKGVLAGGALVNSATEYDPADPNSVDPSHYVVIVSLYVAGIPVVAQYNVPVSLKKGNGATKPDISGLMAILPVGVSRSIGAMGGSVWGPLGTSASDPAYLACRSNLNTSIPFPPGPDIPPGVWLPDLGDNPCQLGSMIGLWGINIP
jgi:hypothetical protein